MTFDPFVAVRLTPYHAARTGWATEYRAVFGRLGFRTRNPTAREFVMTVHDWQRTHPPLAADGLLTSDTWVQMWPEVQAYTGDVPAGTRPEWLDPPADTPDAPTPTGVEPAVPAGVEDQTLQRLVKTWLNAGELLRANPYLAVPVGGRYAAHQANYSLPALPTAGLCGTLRVGQVWPGASGGSRTVLALVPGAVVFVTDGGQAYHQTAEAWGLDYLTGLYAGTVRTVSPVNQLSDAEVSALLGRLAAAGDL